MKQKTWTLQRPLRKFTEKNFQGQVCLSPFVSMSIDLLGDVYLCGCSGWLPSPVGNLYHESLADILSGSRSVEVRQSIIRGTFDYCNESTCGVIRQGALNSQDHVDEKVQWLLGDATRFIMPREIWISGDLVCNLSCPSCRSEIIKNSDDQLQQYQDLGRKLKDNLFSAPTDQFIKIHVSTSGELFASPLLLEFVSGIDVGAFPGARLAIQTNGLLMPSRWDRLGDMQDRVDSVTITVDAAQEKTYELLRRGGKWQDIQQALQWAADKKQHSNFVLKTRMVVQKQNYQEMLDFYHMSKNFRADLVEYTRISNWGTYSQDEFRSIDVFDSAHPEFALATDQLNQVQSLPGVFVHGGL